MNNAHLDILNILAVNARTPMEQIATMTGRGIEEVRQVIVDCEKRGIIKCYKTVIDWEKAGAEKIIAFIDVKVTPAQNVGFDAIAMRLSRYSEVHSVWLVAGGSDLRLVVEAQNIKELGSFVAEQLATISGVTATDTCFILRRYKEDDNLFVDENEDSRLAVSP